MNTHRPILLAVALLIQALPSAAQPASELDSLKQELQQAQDAFDKAMREHREFIDSIRQRIQSIEQRAQGTANLASQPPVISTNTATAATPAPSPSTVSAGIAKPVWSPTDPITLGRAGQAYMNLSLDVLLDAGWSTAKSPADYLQLGGHDPSKRGFSLPNAELAIDGAVDPYFKGFANVALFLNPENETEIELEEAYLLSTSLPANLQAKAGQFYAAFGRHNPTHPHQWDFVDQPILLNRAFGPDGLRNPGAQLNWLAPLPFFTELGVGVFDGSGATAHSFRNPGEDDGTGVTRMHGRATLGQSLRGAGDLLFVPRVASSFDLTANQTLVAGASAAFGKNDTAPDTHTQVYGADLYWKWKSPRAQKGFPFVSWQTEALYQTYEAGADLPAGLPFERLQDYGFYSQVLWGFRPRWVAGLRGEFATGNDGLFDAMDVHRGERTRVSPNLTWYVSEFSKIRLQYNYDHLEYYGNEHSIWLQLEFMLGAHPAHKF